MRNKLVSMLLSVILAFGLWLYVINIVSPGSEETFYNILIALDGDQVLAERGLMITDMSAVRVNMRLSGSRLDLSKLDSGNITVKADVSGITDPGSRIYVPYSTSFPGNLSSGAFVIQSRTPERLYVSVERRISKSVPVEISWQGSSAEGFMADRKNRELEYDTVQIAGPQSVVDQIEKAVIVVDLTDARESISQDSLFTLCDAENNPVDASYITANVETIHINVKIQRVKDLKLVYNLVEGGGAVADNAEITLSVDTIRVSGSDAVIELLGDELGIGTINLQDIIEDCAVVLTIPLEEGVTNLTGVTEVLANIHLKDLVTADFLVTDIQAENIPEGLAAEVITRELMVHVRGSAELLSRLTDEDIRVLVDLSEGVAGETASYDVRVEFAPGFEGLGTIMDGSVFASLWGKSDPAAG